MIQGYRLLSPRYGPAFWIYTSYCYALLCLSAWLLARSALALGGVLRKQMLCLSACLLIPLAINMADLLKVIPLPYREYDLTAATFVVTGVLGLVLLRRFHLINVAPVSYSLVVQEMLDAIIVLDAWGRIAGVNRAALRLIGRLDKDIVGLPGDVIPSWLRIPEHLSRLEGPAELSYRLGADSRDPGSTYDVRVSRFPHGRVPGWLVIIRDISAQSRAEAERTARIAAEQANWAKDAFLAKLSHELRTPLTPVLAITSATLDQPSIPPELRSALEIVQRNVHLEARLIDDLLDQSLITLGKLRLRTELVDVHGLLHQSLANCAEFIRDADLIARLVLSATNSWIAADPGRLQQVFWNLIINAARYSPARGHLTIRTRNIGADALEIEFQDEGRGLERRSWRRSSSPSSRLERAVPNDVPASASACRSAGRLSKRTGAPSSRRVRVSEEGPLSESSSAPPTLPMSRRSIDRGREARPRWRPPSRSPRKHANSTGPRRFSSWRTTRIL